MRKSPVPLVPAVSPLPRRRSGPRSEPVHVAGCRSALPKSAREAEGAGPVAIRAPREGAADARPGERRRLAAILAADVVSYSRLLAEDEAATLTALRAARARSLEPLATVHGGRVFAATGDGFLAEFPSSVLALHCALALQAGTPGSGPDWPGARRLAFRVGVHQGEVIEEDGMGVTGVSVVIAVRLEALAEPGGVCISGRVREDVAGKLALETEDLGERALKNVPWSVRTLRVRSPAPVMAVSPTASLGPLSAAGSPLFDLVVGDRERECFVGRAGCGSAAPSLVRRLLVAVARGLAARRGRTAAIHRGEVLVV